MELVKFRDQIYGKYKTQLFVWESSWDSFRPIETIVWNGKQITVVEKYKDLFSPWYGFGSPEMKEACKKLTEITELSTAKEVDIFEWLNQGEWWRDRKCNLLPCVSRSPQEWKKYLLYLNTKPKTLKQKFKHRATKRLIAK